MMCNLVCVDLPATRLRAIPVGSAEPARASHLSQALRVPLSAQTSRTHQALGTPGAEFRGNPEEGTRWLRWARGSGPHTHLQIEGSGLLGHLWLPAWLLPALQPPPYHSLPPKCASKPSLSLCTISFALLLPCLGAFHAHSPGQLSLSFSTQLW